MRERERENPGVLIRWIAVISIMSSIYSKDVKQCCPPLKAVLLTTVRKVVNLIFEITEEHLICCISHDCTFCLLA